VADDFVADARLPGRSLFSHEEIMQRKALAIGVSLLALSASTAAYAVTDEDFLKTAIETNLAEIAAGQLGQEKGSSDAVKSYGEELVADHTAANEEAKALATSKQVTVPSAPSAEEQKAAESMATLTGAEFDREFASHMAMGHEKAIALFEDKADDSDNEVSAFAKKTLPTLQKHLETAQSLVEGEGSAMAPTGTPMEQTAPSTDTSVTDTSASTPEAGAPFEGANSFTEAQAQERAANAGFSEVSALTKDDKGIWRGTANSNTGKVSIAVDYKGNVVAGTN
jgi:putative membrane protein